MEVIKDILLELRPRLRSCNVTILTKDDSHDQYNIKVSVRPNFIILGYMNYELHKTGKIKKTGILRKDSTSSYESYSESDDDGNDDTHFLNVAPYCKILPSSLSLINGEPEYMTFRILTEPLDSTSGTFYNEVVNNVENEYATKTNATEDYVHIDRKIINVNNQDNVKLSCANCLNNLTVVNSEVEKFVLFNRVLELPSDNLDVSDWFCHGECSNDKSIKLTPRNNDLFYGLCCFIINNSNLSANFLEFNKNRNILHCDRCLSWLGIKHDSVSIKFYDSCIKFCKIEHIDQHFHFFSEKNQDTTMNVGLVNFLYAIKYAIKCSFSSAVSTKCKIIFECDLAKDKKQYMLVWVMDKFLDILMIDKCGMNVKSDNKNEIKLKHVLTSKLLYRIDNKSDLVNDWLNDSSAQSYEISKDMFTEGKKHLDKMSLYIPNSYRFSNDFWLTYLKL